MKIEDLREFLTFLRSQGVLSFTGGGVSVTLLPQKPNEEATAATEPPKEAELLSDGLTREGQIELYGSVLG